MSWPATLARYSTNNVVQPAGKAGMIENVEGLPCKSRIFLSIAPSAHRTRYYVATRVVPGEVIEVPVGDATGIYGVTQIILD